jgi:hypothetical protein
MSDLGRSGVFVFICSVVAAGCAVAGAPASQGPYPLDVVDLGIDHDKLPFDHLVVVQDHHSRHTWLAAPGPDLTVPRGPVVPLAGVLRVAVKGAPGELTVCGAAPGPCLPPERIAVDPAIAIIDSAGLMHLAWNLGQPSVARLLQLREVRVPLRVGQATVMLQWPVRMRARPLLFHGSPDASPGADGPALSVEVDARDPLRWAFSIRLPGRAVEVVVDTDQLADFSITSRGGAGRSDAGTRVYRHGADGGTGGDITARVLCPPDRCQPAVATVRALLHSEGGGGGLAALSLAPGTDTSTADPLFVGDQGAPGKPGRVEVRVAPAFAGR